MKAGAKWLYSFRDARGHDDYSVIGGEFCDFLASLLSCRLAKRFDSARLLDDMSYKKVMAILDRARKVRSDQGDWRLIRINAAYTEVLQKPGLLPKPEENPEKEARET